MGFSLKSLLPRSLMGRSLMILVVPVVVVQIVTTIVFFDRHWERVTLRLSEALIGEIKMLAEEIEFSDDDDGHAQIISRAQRHFDFYVTYLPDEFLESQAMVHQADLGWESIVASVFVPKLEERLGRAFDLNLQFEDKWVVLQVQLVDGVMIVEFPQRRLFSSSGYIYLLWVFGSALLLLFIAIVFMRNQVRPIRKLAAAAERFGRGRDVQFFKPQGAREVRQAGESFMSMHRRIRRQIEQRTLMLAGVSHDLRTPLTRLKLEVSMMPDTLDKANILNDLNDMERMISGYLGFIRGEGDETEVRVNLGVFLADIVNDQQRDGFQINTDIDADFNIDIRVVAMERCLNNILSNARQYGTRALVRAFRDGDRAHIIIEDDGPGIPPEEYDEVFKPFYRSDKARANPDGHVGLGLSIAMDVVHMHGGRIWLDRSNDLGGLAVNIRLPI